MRRRGRNREGEGGGRGEGNGKAEMRRRGGQRREWERCVGEGELKVDGAGVSSASRGEECRCTEGVEGH